MTIAFTTPSPLAAAGLTRSELRQALKQLRDCLPQRAQRESALDSALARELRELRVACIGAYCASRGEYDALKVVLRVAEQLGWPWRLALPVVRPSERSMSFHDWRPGQELHAGAYGIAEPAPQAPALEPEVLLVPCVGFADDGLRLGYGGGYYDRYLEHRRRVRTIGLAFDACRVEGLSAQPHDRPLDLILTESARHDRSAP